MKIIKLRHAYPEPAGFHILRPAGRADYTFLHFHSSVDLRLGDSMIHTMPHACILFRPETPQDFSCDHPLIHDWMHFTAPENLYGLEPDQIFYPANPSLITHLIRELELEFHSNRQNREELLQLKFSELFLKLGREWRGEHHIPIDSATADRFRALRSALFSDLGAPHPIAEMAAAVGLSQSRFFAVYKILFGTSPNDDLIRARIDAAQNMLSAGEQPLSAIAEQLGYRNFTHFMRQFKSVVGTSPAAWRKEHPLK